MLSLPLDSPLTNTPHSINQWRWAEAAQTLPLGGAGEPLPLLLQPGWRVCVATGLGQVSLVDTFVLEPTALFFPAANVPGKSRSLEEVKGTAKGKARKASP